MTRQLFFQAQLVVRRKTRMEKEFWQANTFGLWRREILGRSATSIALRFALVAWPSLRSFVRFPRSLLVMVPLFIAPLTLKKKQPFLPPLKSTPSLSFSIVRWLLSFSPSLKIQILSTLNQHPINPLPPPPLNPHLLTKPQRLRSHPLSRPPLPNQTPITKR